MIKPYLLVVTGRAGAGKTTFAKTLGTEIFMPVISRDHIKEGYVHTFGKSHLDLPQETNAIVTKIFFETIKGLIDNNVSIIVEAAFQNKIWSSMLEQFMDKAQIHILICKIDEKLALDRFIQRGLNNNLREFFHGDKGVDMARKGMKLSIEPYEEPHLQVPTLYVDTLDEYNPSVDEIKKVIFKQSH